jgi:hypothetical protein
VIFRSAGLDKVFVDLSRAVSRPAPKVANGDINPVARADLFIKERLEFDVVMIEGY